MLSPHFKEGSTLTAQSKVSIPLPDDDPDTMVILCKSIHMRFDMRAEDISLGSLLKLGVVVDKYDSSRGMGGLPYYWIHKHLPSPSTHGLASLFVASYLLNESKMFQRLGYDLQMTAKGEMQMKLLDEHHPDVFKEVVGKFYLAAKMSSKTDPLQPK